MQLNFRTCFLQKLHPLGIIAGLMSVCCVYKLRVKCAGTKTSALKCIWKYFKIPLYLSQLQSHQKMGTVTICNLVIHMYLWFAYFHSLQVRNALGVSPWERKGKHLLNIAYQFLFLEDISYSWLFLDFSEGRHQWELLMLGSWKSSPKNDKQRRYLSLEKAGAEEMAQGLKVLATPAEDPGQSCSTTQWAQQNSIPGDQMSSNP